MKLLAAAISFIFASTSANAAELTETWTSVRALGMGNAFTAVVTGADSLFYNPAGLSRSLIISWTMFDPRGGINGMNAVNTINDLGSTDDIPGLVDPLYGKRFWGGAGVKSAVQVGNFAAAGFGGADISAMLSNRASPVFNLNYFLDYGVAVGAGVSVGGLANFGITARRITRMGTAAPLTAGDFAEGVEDSNTFKDKLQNEGIGYGMDLGAVFAAPGPISPAFSVVWKNVGTTSFRASGTEVAPQRINDEIIVGAAVAVDLPLISITPAIDFKHLNRSDVQTGKKIHVGVEVSLPLLDLRAGLHQGYASFGAGFNTGILRIDAATYGVELGAYPGQLEDRRYMAQLSIDLGFDFGGLGSGSSSSSGSSPGSSSSGGGRVRVKQRR